MFCFLSPRCVLTLFHHMSASQHFMEKARPYTWLASRITIVRKKLNKTCLQHRRAGGDKLMRKSSGGPENDLLGAQLLHSYTDQTTYQEKEYQNDIK